MINENRVCNIIGINKVVANRLEKGTKQQQKENNTKYNKSENTIYPCKVQNRFEYPREKGEKIIEAKFDEYLFALDRMANGVVIEITPVNAAGV